MDGGSWASFLGDGWLGGAARDGATRYNPVLKSLYDRLKKRGKPAKSALIARARKLLISANAVVARGTPWEDRSTTSA